MNGRDGRQDTVKLLVGAAAHRFRQGEELPIEWFRYGAPLGAP
jgi:hypothetical protein